MNHSDSVDQWLPMSCFSRLPILFDPHVYKDLHQENVISLENGLEIAWNYFFQFSPISFSFYSFLLLKFQDSLEKSEIKGKIRQNKAIKLFKTDDILLMHCALISKTSSVLNRLIALFCLFSPFISLFSRLSFEISKVKMNKMRNLWKKTEKNNFKLFQDHFRDWWHFPDAIISINTIPW